MPDIDFLPAEYHQRHAQRQSRPWQIIVAVAFGALVSVAALGQHHCRAQAEAELAAATAPYELAVSQHCRLAEIQNELRKARSTAELCVYLRHPWPRTQLLVALLAPRPDEIIFEQLHITREKPPTEPAADRRLRTEKPAEEEELNKLSSAERDLKRFREECDKMRTVIHVAGTTGDSGALHRYLNALGKHSLFAKAELDSLESLEGKAATVMKFRATVVVRPGYGQAGGPTRRD